MWCLGNVSVVIGLRVLFFPPKDDGSVIAAIHHKFSKSMNSRDQNDSFPY